MMEEAPGFLECILKNCQCFNTSLTFKRFNFLYHCFLAASLESEGGAWGLRAAGVSEMMKCLKKAVFFFFLSLSTYELLRDFCFNKCKKGKK